MHILNIVFSTGISCSNMGQAPCKPQPIRTTHSPPAQFTLHPHVLCPAVLSPGPRSFSTSCTSAATGSVLPSAPQPSPLCWPSFSLTLWVSHSFILFYLFFYLFVPLFQLIFHLMFNYNSSFVICKAKRNKTRGQINSENHILFILRAID